MGEEINNKYMVTPLAVPENDVYTNFETDPALRKDVHAFETIFGTNELERKLMKSGIFINKKLAHFLRHAEILGEEVASDLMEMPAFHLVLQTKYEHQFDDYGKWRINGKPDKTNWTSIPSSSRTKKNRSLRSK